MSIILFFIVFVFFPLDSQKNNIEILDSHPIHNTENQNYNFY